MLSNSCLMVKSLQIFSTGDGVHRRSTPRTPIGKHLLVEYYGCEKETLNDQELIRELMFQAATKANVEIVASVFHRFPTQGVTGVVVLAESHLSIHTWPEHDYAAVDFFTCGEGLPEHADEVLLQGLRALRAERILLVRGGGRKPTRLFCSDPDVVR